MDLILNGPTIFRLYIRPIHFRIYLILTRTPRADGDEDKKTSS